MKKTFEAWMEEVEAYVEGLVGLSYLDFPDCPFYEWFSRGMNSLVAARKVVKG